MKAVSTKSHALPNAVREGRSQESLAGQFKREFHILHGKNQALYSRYKRSRSFKPQKCLSRRCMRKNLLLTHEQAVKSSFPSLQPACVNTINTASPPGLGEAWLEESSGMPGLHECGEKDF